MAYVHKQAIAYPPYKTQIPITFIKYTFAYDTLIFILSLQPFQMHRKAVYANS